MKHPCHSASSFTWPWALCALLTLGAQAPAAEPNSRATQSQPATAPAVEWYALPIHVSGLVPGGDGVTPISVSLDFAALLQELAAGGTIDPQALELREVTAGTEHDASLSVQFQVAPQPGRQPRQLLPGTPASVSYGLELDAAAKPSYPCTGELTWMAAPSADGTAHYLLRFAVPQAGRLIQVPYPPRDLRAFDTAGRALPARQFPTMQIRPQRPLDGRVELLAANQAVLGYHVGPLLPTVLTPGSIRRPFLYPVVGPDGVGLTEFGKPHDPTDSHAHHYSLWIAHNDVGGQSFWSEKGGSIHHEQFELLEDGPVFCRAVQRTSWLADKPILRERRQTTLYHTPDGLRLFDIELEFAPAENGPVTLGKTSFGFLAARVAQSMSVFDGGGEIVNSAGQRNEQGAHLQHAKWLDQSGPIAPGRWNGIAIFDHPQNPRYPTGWHCRNDGWAGASFTLDEPYVIEPDKPLRLRYRICLHRGNAEQGNVATHWAQFATDPKIDFGRPQKHNTTQP